MPNMGIHYNPAPGSGDQQGKFDRDRELYWEMVRRTVGDEYAKRQMESYNSDQKARQYHDKQIELWKQGNTPGTTWALPYSEMAAQQAASLPGQQEDDITTRMKAFTDKMMAGADLNDPKIQQIMQAVRTVTARASQNRGLGRTGFSNLNSERAMKDSLLGIDQQMQGLGLQAINMESNRDIGLKNLQQQADALQYGVAKDQNAAQTGTGQVIGGLVGGGLGALTAFIPGVGPAIAPAAIGAGAQLGAGLGGSIAGGSGPNFTPGYQSAYGKGNYKGGY